MVALPTAADIATPEPRPDTNSVAYSRQFGGPGVIGQAVSGIGREVTNEQDESDQFDYAKARSQYLVNKTDIESKIQEDPNWQNAPDAYKQAMVSNAQDAGSLVSNPKFKARFDEEAAQDFATGNAAVNHYVRGKTIDQGRGDLDTMLESNRLGALSNPKDAAGFISSTQSALDGAVGKGFISSDEAGKTRQAWLANYGRGYLTMLPDDQQQQVLQRSLPGSGTAGAAPTSAPAGNVSDAIFGQESGYGSNSRTSDKGAVGPSQITPATAKANGLDPSRLQDPAYATYARNTIIANLQNDPNIGNDPARIAVGYFSGPGNVAPPGSPTPWKVDRSDGHTLTSQYVSGVLGRMKPAASDAAPQPANDDASSQPANGLPETAADLTAPPGQMSARTGTPVDFVDPAVRAQMLDEVNRRLKADGAVKNTAYANNVRDQISYLAGGGDPSKVTITPQQIQDVLPGQQGAELADEYGHAADLNAAVKRIATASDADVQNILAGHVPQGPTDFRMNDQELTYLAKAAQQRQTAIYGNGKTPGDPAGYALSNFPDVQAAASAVPNDPSYAAAAKDPSKFAAYVARLDGAYTTLNVPPQLRRILPQSAASATVTRIQTASPTDAVATMDNLKKSSGSAWPRVFGDLTRAGLPATFQTIETVSAAPQDRQTIINALQMDADNKAAGKDPIDKQMDGIEYTDGSKTYSVKTGVDHALAADPGMNSLRATFGVAGRPGTDQFAGVQSAVRTTAFYLYQKGGLSPDQATAKASAMVTGQYDFVAQGQHPPARLPKGTSADFTAATTSVLDNLKPTDIQPYPQQGDEAHEHVIQSTPEQLREAAFQGAKNAYWVAVPGADGNGAVRAMDPQGRTHVIMANGQPLEIPMAKFSYLATRARTGNTDATHDRLPFGPLGFLGADPGQ